MGLRRAAGLRRLAAGLLLGLAAHFGAQAASMRYCDKPPEASAAQLDRQLRLAALLKRELEASGRHVALVARSGLDLGRFGIRYSHAGIGLLDSPNTPWSVRQLYYACDEDRPRLFDQGLAGFIAGTDDPDHGYLSVLLLPPAAGALLAQRALDPRRALALLGSTYSANAYAYSTRYQNCNQWLVELMASAWGGLDGEGEPARQQAQAWLQAHGYTPSRVALGQPLWRLAAAFVPWLHTDDHPPEADQALRYDISLPAAIEAFVHDRVPGARRFELCHRGAVVVLRRGWTPLPEGCRPEPGDTVLSLE